jgi:hypothetical protein
MSFNNNSDRPPFSTIGGSKTGARNEQRVPHAEEAEIGLLNLAIRDSQCLYKIQEAGIQPEHFFSELAGSLFELVIKLTIDGKGAHPGKFNIIQALKKDYTEEYLDYYYDVTKEVIAKDWLTKFIKELINISGTTTRKRRGCLKGP